MAPRALALLLAALPSALTVNPDWFQAHFDGSSFVATTGTGTVTVQTPLTSTFVTGYFTGDKAVQLAGFSASTYSNVATCPGIVACVSTTGVTGVQFGGGPTASPGNDWCKPVATGNVAYQTCA